MVNSRGIMLVQDAYDLLIEEKLEGESYSECIIRVIEDLRSYRNRVDDKPSAHSEMVKSSESSVSPGNDPEED